MRRDSRSGLYLPPGLCEFRGGQRGPRTSVGGMKPYITGISPAFGDEAGGDSVEVTLSSGAQAVTAVLVGTSAATITARTLTAVTFTTPAGSGGQSVIVKIGDYVVRSTTDTVPTFTYEAEPGGDFPEEYSISRSLITSNPGSLLWGHGLESITQQSDIENEAYGIWYVGDGIGDATVEELEANPGTFWAHVDLTDPAFPACVRRHYIGQGDETGAFSAQTCARFLTNSFTGKHRIWMRRLFKCSSNFNSRAYSGYTGNAATKWIWSNRMRHMEMTDSQNMNQSFQWITGGGEAQPGGWTPGGSDQRMGSGLIPHIGLGCARQWGAAADAATGNKPWMAQSGGSPNADGDWYGEIMFEGYFPDQNKFQRCLWFHRYSTNGVLHEPILMVNTATSDCSAQSWPSGTPCRSGYEQVNMTSTPVTCSRIRLQVNKNAQYEGGTLAWVAEGPLEVIDDDVIKNPYNLDDDTYAAIQDRP